MATISVVLGLASGCAVLGSPGPCSSGLVEIGVPGSEACLSDLQSRPEISKWIDESGAPDYVEVLSSSRIRLFYIARDQVVTFEEGLIGGLSPSVTTRIRSSDHTRFTDADRKRLGDIRMGDVASPPPEPAPRGVTRGRVGEE